MISTRFITGTGLKKCIPITRSGRSEAAARRVSEIEEVLEAKIVSGPQIASRLLSTFDLISMFSTIASTTSARSASACGSVAVAMRPSVASAASAAIFSRLIRRARLASMAPRPRASASAFRSCISTGNPAAAKICAIPAPIVPAPITPIASFAIFRAPQSPLRPGGGDNAATRQARDSPHVAAPSGATIALGGRALRHGLRGRGAATSPAPGR